MTDRYAVNGQYKDNRRQRGKKGQADHKVITDSWIPVGPVTAGVWPGQRES